MPMLAIRSIAMLLGACIIFLNGLNMMRADDVAYKVTGHHLSKDKIVFFVKTKVGDKSTPTVVEIPIKKDNDGNTKIKWKIGDANVELETTNEEHINKLINSLTDYIDNSQTMTQRTKGLIRNFVSSARKSLGKIIAGGGK